MALKPEYLVRETATNFTRNLTLTAASIITMFVALVLFGAARMFQQGTDNGTDRFRDGVEFVVFLNPEVTGEQLDSISAELTAHPDVDAADFVTKEEAFAQFQEWFSNEPELIETISVAQMPPSFEVKPRIADPQLVESLAGQFRGSAGVMRVETAQETTQTIIGIADSAQRWMFWFAAAALAGGSLLIFNTVRVAMFARRREIEVMKLVGASNWYIRMPFILEGLLHGLFGGLLAAGVVRFLNQSLENDVVSSGARLLENFFIADGDMFTIMLTVVGAGVLVGVACSAFAVGRFLDV